MMYELFQFLYLRRVTMTQGTSSNTDRNADTSDMTAIMILKQQQTLLNYSLLYTCD